MYFLIKIIKNLQSEQQAHFLKNLWRTCEKFESSFMFMKEVIANALIFQVKLEEI